MIVNLRYCSIWCVVNKSLFTYIHTPTRCHVTLAALTLASLAVTKTWLYHVGSCSKKSRLSTYDEYNCFQLYIDCSSSGDIVYVVCLYLRLSKLTSESLNLHWFIEQKITVVCTLKQNVIFAISTKDLRNISDFISLMGFILLKNMVPRMIKIKPYWLKLFLMKYAQKTLDKCLNVIFSIFWASVLSITDGVTV